MPLFTFIDTQARVYVDRALVVQPGDEVDWPDGAPDDGQWIEKSRTTKPAKPVSSEE